MQFLMMGELLQRLGEALAVAQTDLTPSVSFPDFEQGWKAFGAKHCGESALTAWTEIQTVIKGSTASITSGRPLTLDEYQEVGKNKSSVDAGEQRTAVFAAFKAYEAFKGKGMDEGDCVLALLRKVKSGKVEVWESGTPPFEYGYVDEVQDIRPTELALLLLACGNTTERLTISGDTAQQITPGVTCPCTRLQACPYTCHTQV
jgi:hypothetical protein